MSTEWSYQAEFMRTRPFQKLASQDPAYQVTVRLKRFFQRVAEEKLDADFHRLSGRVVLAVVMLRRSDGTCEFYEGVNTEVAIQTGSLCAERAAIAAARADIPSLARFEICAIGTIYAPLTTSEPEPSKNPSWPCGVCMEWIKKACGKSEMMRIIGFPSTKFESVIERFICLNTIAPVSFDQVKLVRYPNPSSNETISISDLVVCDACSSVHPRSDPCLLCKPGLHSLQRAGGASPLRTKRVADQTHAVDRSRFQNPPWTSPQLGACTNLEAVYEPDQPDGQRSPL